MINEKMFEAGKRYDLKTVRGRKFAIEAVIRGYFENEAPITAAEMNLYFPDEEAENNA